MFFAIAGDSCVSEVLGISWEKNKNEGHVRKFVSFKKGHAKVIYAFSEFDLL